MKHILKFIVGFLFILVILFLSVAVVNFGWYVFYGVVSVFAVYCCYTVGSCVWNIVELAYYDWKSR